MRGYTRVLPPTVYDLVSGHGPIDLIMVRTNDPWGGDTLYGYCAWDGEKLISLDGDDYGLYDEVTSYEWPECGPVQLIYAIRSEWITNEEELDGSSAEEEV